MATPDDAVRTMIANLAAKTGRTLEQWLALVGTDQKRKHGELVQWLKREHGVTHGYANLIAHQAQAGAPAAPATGSAGAADDLVAAQYAGAKAALRPLYEALLAVVRGFGDDVEVAPKKAYVSLRRSKQFAMLQPSTATRLDVGLNLKGVPPTARLEPSGSFSSMVSHRVRLGQPADIDGELRGWLRQAYDAS